MEICYCREGVHFSSQSLILKAFSLTHSTTETVHARSDASLRLKSVSQDTQQILDEFNRTYKEAEKTDEATEKIADKFNAVSMDNDAYSIESHY